MSSTSTSVTATRSATFNDTDGDTFLEPGQVVAHFVTIANTGTPTGTGQHDAKNVVVENILTGATFNGSINISPIARNDSFSAVGNTLLEVGNVTSQTGPQTSFAGSVTSNDTDTAGDVFVITGLSSDNGPSGVTASGLNGSLLAPTISITSTHGGAVTIVTSGADKGSFTYLSAAGFEGTDTFTYEIRDDGYDNILGNADDLTDTGTVTITVTQSVWYINTGAAAGGNGTSTNPFNSIAAFNSPDLDDENDFIHITGSASGNIVLEAGQKLYGTGATLTTEGLTIAATGGANNSVTASTGTVVTLGTGNTIAGIDIVGTSAAAGLTGANFGTLSVEGVSVNTATGQILNLSNGTAAATGVDFVNLTSSGSVANTAVFISNLDGGPFTATYVGVAATNGVGSDGLYIGGGSGASFNIGSVAISGAGDDGIEINGTGGASGAVTIGSVAIDNTGISSTTNGHGIEIAAGNSKVTVTSGNIGNLNDPVGDGVNITGGTGEVSIGAAISKNTAGHLVEVNGHTTGSVTFSGALSGTAGLSNGILVNNSAGLIEFTNASKVLNTGANAAVTLSNNAGGTVNFTGGGLAITTSGGTGFSATGGGTVSVTGTGNTVNSGQGTAVRISNTNIGGDDVIFQKITSSGGTATGIVLDTTGTTGNFRLTGNGATVGASGGGVIENKTGADNTDGLTGNAVYLNNTTGVELNGLLIQNMSNHGIRGLSVNGIKLTNTTISGTIGDASGGTDSAIAFGTSNPAGANGLSGFSLIDNVNVSGAVEHSLEVYQQSGSFHLTIQNSNIHHNSTASGSDGILIETQGTATGTVRIHNNQFSDLKSQAIQAAANDSSTLNLTVSNNTITRGGQGNEGIVLSNGGNGQLNTTVSSNTISGFGGVSIFVGQTPGNATSSSLLHATITGNTITAPADATNHAVIAYLSATTGHVSQARLLINSNNITHNGNLGTPRAILVDTPDATRTPNFHATVSNNIVNMTHVNAPTAISVAARNTATGHVDVQGNQVTMSGGSTAFGVQVRQATSGTMELMRGGSGAGTAAQVLDDNHPHASTTTTVSGTVTIAANGTILTPSSTPQPTQPLLAEAAPTTTAATTTTGSTEEPAGEKYVDTPKVEAGTPSGSATQTAVVDDGFLSQAELDLLVNAAIDRWAAAGATPEQVAAMRAVQFSVADLGGLYLGKSGAGSIQLDDNAAGFNWFVDTTPGDDAEYAGTGSQLSAVDKLGAAGTRIDLLTVIMHELGHQIGLGDISHAGESDELMYGTIKPGERRLPEADDAAAGSAAPVSGAFAIAPVTVGDIPEGETVRVRFESVVLATTNTLVGSVVHSSTVTGSNITTQSGTTAYAVDSLTLGDLVYYDANKDGLFNSGDSGIAGVKLTLFVDTNNNGVFDLGTDQAVTYTDNDGIAGFDPAKDTPGGTTLLTATTDANGAYSFANLAPGKYIVRVDASNFTSGGALFGMYSAPGDDAASDTFMGPEDNVNGDDNGVKYSGFVASRAITLAFDQEPTAGPGNDTNNTLDFGFQALRGTIGKDNITGTPDPDFFDLRQGEDDIASGLGSNDVFYFGGAFTGADQVDGGADVDTVVLQGNYSSLVTLASTTLTAVERLSVQTGSETRWGDTANNRYDYNIKFDNANVAAGQQFLVNAQSLLAGEDFTFDGSAETDGRFLIYGGFGVDNLTGGNGNDIFFFEAGRFGAGDKTNGGAGFDFVVISGTPANSSGPLVVDIPTGTFTSIQALSFNGRFASDPAAQPSYQVVLRDGNVNTGEALIVNGSSLSSTQSLSFNGSAVGTNTATLGKLEMYGGAGNDSFIGGAGADLIYAAGGMDTSSGGGGADVFQYREVSDSTTAAPDKILDFANGADKIDLSRIDANSTVAGDQAFTFIGSNAFSGTPGTPAPGQLRASDSGSGYWNVEGDVDGDGMADFLIQVTATGPVVATDFFL